MLGCDSETQTIERWRRIPAPVVWSVATEQAQTALVHAWEPSAKKFTRALFDQETTWANGSYDWAVICREHPENAEAVFCAIRDNLAHDVLTRERLRDIAKGTFKLNSKIAGDGQIEKGYSLAACVYRNFRDMNGMPVVLDKSNRWRLRYEELLPIPCEQWPEDARKYALDDSLAPLALHLHQDARARAWIEEHECDEKNPAAAARHAGGFGVNILHDENRQVRAKWALHLSSCWGMRVDQNAVEEYDAKLGKKWEEASKVLLKAGLVRTDGSRNMEVCAKYMEWLCGQRGIEPVRNAPTKREQEKAIAQGRPPVGAITLDADAVMNPLLGDGHDPDPVWSAYHDYSHIQKLRGTYVQYLRDTGNVPIHPSYNELVDTGRTSCYDPNVQQLPREKGVRECYRAREGNELVTADIVAAELVSLSSITLALCGYSKLADVLKAGGDPHIDLGLELRPGFPLSYAQALALYKATPDQLAQMPPEYKLLKKRIKDEIRQPAKPGSFGYPGGLGPETMIEYARTNYSVRLTMEESIALRQSWRRKYPENVEYLRWISSLVGDSGIANVQHFRSGRCRGRVKYTEAANGFFQGLTADACKHALWCVTWRQFMEPSSALFGTHVFAFIHDEIICETPKDRSKAVQIELAEVMKAAYEEWTYPVPCEVEINVMEQWTKM